MRLTDTNSRFGTGECTYSHTVEHKNKTLPISKEKYEFIAAIFQ